MNLSVHGRYLTVIFPQPTQRYVIGRSSSIEFRPSVRFRLVCWAAVARHRRLKYSAGARPGRPTPFYRPSTQTLRANHSTELN
jgi:hypothetical protein